MAYKGNSTRAQNGKCPKGKRSDAKGISVEGRPQKQVDVGQTGKAAAVKSPGLGKK